MRGRSCGAIPGAVSWTASRTAPFSGAAHSSTQPAGGYLTALTARFARMRRTFPGSLSTHSAPGSTRTARRTCVRVYVPRSASTFESISIDLPHAVVAGPRVVDAHDGAVPSDAQRSEERRVGKE